MSLLLATALLATPATLPSCSWDRPGVNPFMGDVVAAVDRYADIPADVRGKLKARLARRQYDEIATITRDGIHGKARYDAAIRDMHFGAGQVCHTVTRERWGSRHQERGLVYCESGHCIIVPTVCRNVSRITRLDGRAEAAAARPVAVSPAEHAPDEAPVSTAGGDAADDTLPRLRSGGSFTGTWAPTGAPAAAGAGGGPLPEGGGPRFGAAVGSVVSTVRKTVREVLDRVSSLPVFRTASDPTPSAPQGVSSPAPAPASPGAPEEPGPSVTPGDPTPGQEPGPAPAPGQEPGAAPTPGLGGHSGSSADPGPLLPGDATPAVTGGSGVSDQGGDRGNGDGGGGGPTVDPVQDLIDEIDLTVDTETPRDGLPTGDGMADDLAGGEGGGGGSGGAGVPGGELPEPATPALVLLAAVAAGAASRRRKA